MRNSGALKFPNFRVLPGGVSPFRGRRRGRRTQTAAEMVLDRDMHTASCALVGRDGNVASESIQKIRTRQHWPWRVMARRIIEAHAAGVPHRAVRQFVLTMLAWVDRLYDTKGETVAEHITYHQGPRFSGPFTRVA